METNEMILVAYVALVITIAAAFIWWHRARRARPKTSRPPVRFGWADQLQPTQARTTALLPMVDVAGDVTAAPIPTHRSDAERLSLLLRRYQRVCHHLGDARQQVDYWRDRYTDSQDLITNLYLELERRPAPHPIMDLLATGAAYSRAQLAELTGIDEHQIACDLARLMLETGQIATHAEIVNGGPVSLYRRADLPQPGAVTAEIGHDPAETTEFDPNRTVQVLQAAS